MAEVLFVDRNASFLLGGDVNAHHEKWQPRLFCCLSLPLEIVSLMKQTNRPTGITEKY